MKTGVMIIACVLITMPVAFAQDSSNNFTISPPPIPWFEFQSGQQDLRVGATGMYIKGKDNPDLEIMGAGGNFIYRGAFGDFFAVDVGAVLLGAGGDVAADTTTTMFMYNPTLNLEFQLLRTEWASMILFGGGNLSLMKMDTESELASTDFAVFTYGPQAGLQVSLKLGPLSLSPFFMWQAFKGTANYTVGDYSGSMGIDWYSTYTFGFDIVFVPLNITLSSLLQMKPNTDDDMSIYIFSVSYDFRWGITESSSEDTYQ